MAAWPRAGSARFPPGIPACRMGLGFVVNSITVWNEVPAFGLVLDRAVRTAAHGVLSAVFLRPFNSAFEMRSFSLDADGGGSPPRSAGADPMLAEASRSGE